MSTPEALTRGTAIQKRWGRMFAYALCGAAITLLFLWNWGVCNRSTELKQGLITALACSWTEYYPWPLALLAVLFVLRGFQFPGWPARCLRARHWLYYPPLWVAAWLACPWIALAIYLAPSTFSLPLETQSLIRMFWWTWPLGTLLLLELDRWVFRFTRNHTKRSSTSCPPGAAHSTSSAGLPADLPALIAWLKADTPVTSPDGDRFEFHSIAQRMAKRLLQLPAPSQAVIGPLGSGKSTLGKLVQDALSPYPNHRLVQIELWPYANTEAALEAIFKAILKALEQEASLPHLQGLPEHYVNAVKALGGWWEAAKQLLYGNHKNIQEMIEEINETALALDLHLVLWIEDLERFVGVAEDIGHDQKTSFTPEVNQQLGVIRALVHTLQCRCQDKGKDWRITPVFATTIGVTAFGLQKMADFIEKMPAIPLETAAKLIAQIQEQMFSNHYSFNGKPLIDTAAPWVRENLEQHWLEILEALFSKTNGLTIRTFKFALRRALDYWERYPGEVDPEDLLLVRLMMEGGKAEILDRLKNFKGLKQKITETSEESVVNIDRLADLLGLDSQSQEINDLPRPQGYCHYNAKKEDYLNRIQAEPEIAEAARDQARFQEVIRAADNPDELLNRLGKERSGDVIACAWKLGSTEEECYARAIALWKAWLQRAEAQKNDSASRELIFIIDNLLMLTLRYRWGKNNQNQETSASGHREKLLQIVDLFPKDSHAIPRQWEHLIGQDSEFQGILNRLQNILYPASKQPIE